MPDQGDIVLIPVPFTDLTTAKRRPVIILSNNEYHRATPDMVVVAMTSNPTATPYTFTISNDDLAAGTLNPPGTVRADKIYTLSQQLIVKTSGKLNDATISRIRILIQQHSEP